MQKNHTLLITIFFVVISSSIFTMDKQEPIPQKLPPINKKHPVSAVIKLSPPKTYTNTKMPDPLDKINPMDLVESDEE